MTRLALFVLLAILPFARPADAAATRPDFTPEIGTHLPLALTFTDAAGRSATLASFASARPTLILFGYHRCPNLCGIAERDLAEALVATGLPPDAYSVIFATVDPSETPADAAAARRKLADSAPNAVLSAWHFIVGTKTALAALENAVGLSVAQRPGSDLYVHPVAVSALTPDGRLARVLSGLDYDSRDLRLALVEASQGRLGTLGEHILLLCSGFDPTTGRYTTAVMLALRIAGVLAILVMGAGIGALVVTGRTPS